MRHEDFGVYDMRSTILKFMLLAGLAGASGAAIAGQQLLPLPGFKGVKGDSHLHHVQSGDSSYRVNELEQQVRQLNGKVEDLTFQLLQLQDQIRKLQEDNELRFLDIEEKQSGSLQSEEETDTAAAKPGDLSLEKSETSEAGPAPDVNSAQPPKRGAPPKTLGTLTFDDDGNVVDSGAIGAAQTTAALPKMKLPGVFNDGVDGGVEAAEFGPTPDAVLEVAKRALRNKRYERAESALRAHMKAWPKDPRQAQVRFHLGEALFWQKNYVPAANMFLDTHNDHPRADTAPDNLLHLGLALAGLNRREVACVTYAEVLKQYPQARNRLEDRVAAEQASAKC